VKLRLCLFSRQSPRVVSSHNYIRSRSTDEGRHATVASHHHQRSSDVGPSANSVSSSASKQSSWPRLQRQAIGSASRATPAFDPTHQSRPINFRGRCHLAASADGRDADVGPHGNYYGEPLRMTTGGSSSFDSLLNGFSTQTSTNCRQGTVDYDCDFDTMPNGNSRADAAVVHKRRSFSAGQSEIGCDRRGIGRWTTGDGRGHAVTILVQNASTESSDCALQQSYDGAFCYNAYRGSDSAITSRLRRRTLDSTDGDEDAAASSLIDNVELPPVDYRTVMHCLDSCDKILFRHSTTIT
jgi:hypothetical protein